MRNLLAAITLMMVLAVSSTFAKGGLLVSDFSGGTNEQPCTEVDYTIVPTGLTTIVPTGLITIVPTGFTGIIVFTDSATDCTIVPTGK